MLEFNDRQTQWLVELAGVQPVESLGKKVAQELIPTGSGVLEQRQAWLTQEAKKDKRLQAARDQLEQQKSKIRALMEFEVQLKDGRQVKAFSDSELWDPNQEFDAVHHMQQTSEESLSGAEIERLRLGCEALADLRNKLTGTIKAIDWPTIYEQIVDRQQAVEAVAEQWMVSPETIDSVVEKYLSLLQRPGVDPTDNRFAALLKEQPPVTDPQPLFSDLEIRQELFDPLKREKIIPDNEIEDRFNQTFQVFSGASSEYIAALREFSEQAVEDPEQIELRARTNKDIKNVAKIGGEIVGLIGKLSGNQDVEDITKIAGDIIKVTEKIGLLAATSIDVYYGKQAEGIVDQVGAVLETSLKATLGRDAAEYAKWCRAGYTAVVNVKQTAAALLSGESGTVDAAIEQLANGLENAFSIGGNENYGRIGKALKHAFMLKVNGSKIFAYLQQDPPACDLAAAIFGKALTAACKDVLGDPLVSDLSSGISDVSGTQPQTATTPSKEVEESKKQAEDEYNDAMDELVGALDESLDTTVSIIEESRQPLNELQRDLSDPTKRQLLAETLQAESSKLLMLKIEEELKAGTLKPPHEGEDIEQEFIAIEPLIAEVKRAGLYIKLADSIIGAGLKAAGQFIAVASVAAGGKDLLQNMIVSYYKLQQLHQWRMLREDALAAASISSSAFAKKTKALEIGFNESVLKSLLSLAETAGSVLSGGVSDTLKSTGASGGALLEIVLEGRKAEELSQAWAAYRQALRNPGDRIQLREAIEKNSTLTKYALAYAALHDSDPLAKAGLAQVGLTEDVLRDPSAKVRDIVSYLEAVWSSDPTNMKKIYRPGDWQTDVSGDLSLAAWMSNMSAARGEKLGEDKAVNASSGAVEGALVELGNAKSASALAMEKLTSSALSFDSQHQQMSTETTLYKQALRLCDGIKSELKTLQTNVRRVGDELKKVKKTEAWSRPSERVEILKQHLAALIHLGVDRNLTEILEQIDDYFASADRCSQLLEAFLRDGSSHLQALEEAVAKQRDVTQALIVLQKSLRGFHPLRADGKPSQAVGAYIKSVLQKTDATLQELQADDSQQQQISQLQADRREAEDLPAEILNKRQELTTLRQKADVYRTQFRQHMLDHKQELETAQSLK